ncbi:Hypothetical_protein [Hexamita inflata]|uniref:Hypothetical_protein n=1 Tax=Hexamita inflata TaxID=28002 RepID=A0AA86UEW2_9EUKA|nr:Hypothetical protein HINF_LOCUS43080 [Hexamita inflata]
MLGQLKEEVLRLSKISNQQIIPITTDIETFITLYQNNPQQSAQQLKKILGQSNTFYKLAQTREQLEQFGRIQKILNQFKKDQVFQSEPQESFSVFQSQISPKQVVNTFNHDFVKQQQNSLSKLDDSTQSSKVMSLLQSVDQNPVQQQVKAENLFRQSVQQPDISGLVDNVKLLVNQVSMLQKDQSNQHRENQLLRQQLIELKQTTIDQQQLIDSLSSALKQTSDTSANRYTQLKNLFKTFSVQSEFKDNIIILLQKEFEEVKQIFTVNTSELEGQTRRDRITNKLLETDTEFTQMNEKMIKSVNEENGDIDAQIKKMEAEIEAKQKMMLKTQKTTENTEHRKHKAKNEQGKEKIKWEEEEDVKIEPKMAEKVHALMTVQPQIQSQIQAQAQQPIESPQVLPQQQVPQQPQVQIQPVIQPSPQVQVSQAIQQPAVVLAQQQLNQPQQQQQQPIAPQVPQVQPQSMTQPSPQILQQPQTVLPQQQQPQLVKPQEIKIEPKIEPVEQPMEQKPSEVQPNEGQQGEVEKKKRRRKTTTTTE